FRLPRTLADPSMLTDDPDRAAPSGPHTRVAVATAPSRGSGPANAVLTNGARLYVDHAHPEYSGPEVLSARDAVRWDRAGDAIMMRAVERLGAAGRKVAIYKNNVDGKGASYGTHENYLIDRKLAFGDVVQHLTTFLVTRQLVTGAGRVGIGQRSEEAGFQISQRADYIETDVGLQTTYERPIINTRDEPHCDARRFRRLHVIVGDANRFDVANYLKVGVTSLVLWLLERGHVPLQLDALCLTAPVVDMWGVSHNPFDHQLSTQTGRYTALDVLRIIRDLIGEALNADGIDNREIWQVLDTYTRVLDGLDHDPASVAADVEWVAKRELLTRLKDRRNLSWDAPAIRAADLQWHELSDRSLVSMLQRAGRVTRLVDDDEVNAAITTPPTDTRASIRGAMITHFSDRIYQASWSRISAQHPTERGAVTITMPDPYGSIPFTHYADLSYADAIATLE
ncbi:MAG: proteasome accessory factor PafA2 family protein, partial [Bowdeniella nasicola]|nr:proteasome accessory factor PafA2 family protein [Bowdeniella nasicola]